MELISRIAEDIRIDKEFYPKSEHPPRNEHAVARWKFFALKGDRSAWGKRRLSAPPQDQINKRAEPALAGDGFGVRRLRFNLLLLHTADYMCIFANRRHALPNYTRTAPNYTRTGAKLQVYARQLPLNAPSCAPPTALYAGQLHAHVAQLHVATPCRPNISKMG